MIYLASDHGGFQLKKFLKSYLKSVLRVPYKDLGATKHVPTDDYPDFAKKVGQAVVKGKNNLGIIACRTGAGVCVAANKIKGVRAMVGHNIEATEWSRNDDNINVLCLGAEYVTHEHAAAIVKIFLSTTPSNEPRFLRRLKKIEALEKLK